MGENEMCVRVTRAATKRAAAAVLVEDQSAIKKRVVLGELPNLCNSDASADSNSGIVAHKPKRITKTKQIKKSANVKKNNAAILNAEDVDAKSDLDPTSDDPQMCGPYASDIYEYLHKMEVMGVSVLGLIPNCFNLMVNSVLVSN